MTEGDPKLEITPVSLERADSLNELLDGMSTTADSDIDEESRTPTTKRRIPSNLTNRLSSIDSEYGVASNHAKGSPDDLADVLEKLDVKDDEVRHRILKTTGSGSSKKQAKTDAAHKMLKLVHACDTQLRFVNDDIQQRLERLDQKTCGNLTAVSQLQEYCQKCGRNLPKYEEGPAYGATFHMICSVEGQFAAPPKPPSNPGDRATATSG